MTGNFSFAAGVQTVASGHASTVFGGQSIAEGTVSIAFGSGSVANCGGTGPSAWPKFRTCAAFGYGINNTDTEALAVSGVAYAKNFIFNHADARLHKVVGDADPRALLANVERLRVVTRDADEAEVVREGCGVRRERLRFFRHTQG